MEKNCPNCGYPLNQMEGDAGYGVVHYGPFGCEKCHYVESMLDEMGIRTLACTEMPEGEVKLIKEEK